MSHSKAFSVLHATDFPPGTVEAADADGKWDSNMSRYQYPSLVVGGLMGSDAAWAKSWSDTRASAWAFSVSIHKYPTPSENCSF